VTAKRGTILIPSGPPEDPERLHLFVVCSDPCENGNQVVVSISTRINSLCDPTCVLQSHEHDFLKKESFVLYRKARVEAHTTLDAGISKGVFKPHQDMNGQTFLRITKGICASPQTPRKVKTYFGCPPPAAVHVKADEAQ
jgi:hypothetical protein